MKRAFRIFTLLWVGTWPGCSVLTIDVDVYKGPLSNHREVQIEQVAAMAIAAKPLLVELRDRLEADYRYRKESSQHRHYDATTATSPERELEAFRSAGYHPGYMPPDATGFGPIQDDRASRVNAILGLYDDRSSGELVDKAELLRIHVNEYLEALKILDQKPDRAKKLWEAWVGRLRTPGELPPSAPTIQGYLLWQMQAAYWYFLTQEPFFESRKSRVPPWIRMHSIYHSLSGNAFKREYGFSRPPAQPKEDPFNDAFDALSDRDLVSRQARFIFRDGEENAIQDFTEEVTRISASFATCRQALERILEIAVRLIELLDVPPANLNLSEEEFQHAVKDLVKVVGLIVSPYRLAVALREDQDPYLKALIINELRKIGVQDPDGLLASAARRNPGMEPSVASAGRRARATLRDVVRTLIAKDPHGRGPHLLRLHHSLQFTARPELTFGLVRGPSAPKAELDDFKAALTLVRDTLASRLASGLLDRGRTDQGLETLIERYLSAHQRRGFKNDSQPFPELEQLLFTLVHFAEKVLFIANSDTLLNPPKKRGPTIPGPVELVSMAGAALFIGSRVWEDLSTDFQRGPYVQTLQAVGNSILVLVDDIRKHERFDQMEAPRWEREVKGLASVLAPWQKRLDELVQNTAKALSLVKALPQAVTGKQAAVLGDLQDQATPNQALETLRSKLTDEERLTLSGLGVTPLNATVSIGKAKAFSQVVAAVQEAADKGSVLLKKKHEALGRSQTYMAAIAVPRDKATGKGPKAVVDLIITSLQYLRIQAIATLGTDSDDAKRLTAAIKAAYEYRAGMIFIRPSSSYLRTSYPASSLQQDAKLHWKNTLDRQAYRALPFIGEAITNAGMNIHTAQEIDKQFWQNINRVRVAGAGDTNFVVAKDDVGNWYVKGYSTDVDSIIQAATGMAQFGLSHAMGGRLNVPNAPDPQGTAASVTPGDDPADPKKDRVEKELDKKKDEYDKETSRHLKDLGGEIESLKDSLQKDGESESVRKEFLEVIAKGATGLTTEKEGIVSDTSTRDGGKIIDLLWAVKRFHSGMLRQIDEAESANTADPITLEERSKVKALVTRHVGALLKPNLRRRRRAIERYETTLEVVSSIVEK